MIPTEPTPQPPEPPFTPSVPETSTPLDRLKAWSEAINPPMGERVLEDIAALIEDYELKSELLHWKNAEIKANEAEVAKYKVAFERDHKLIQDMSDTDLDFGVLWDRIQTALDHPFVGKGGE